MTEQAARAASFRASHLPGSPLVLFNVWDAGSARAVTSAGARALATGSWAVAAAHGFADGEKLPLDLVMANLQRIIAVTELPVSIDLESGYGANPGDVASTVGRAIAAGAVGCNLEDSYPADGALRPLSEAAQRIAAARAAADRSSIQLFINARCDVFFQTSPEAHDRASVATALERAQAYADAGADGLFVPGLLRTDLIGAVVEASPLPVNIMVGGASPPLSELAELGVGRISFGPGPYVAAMKGVQEAAEAAIAALT